MGGACVEFVFSGAVSGPATQVDNKTCGRINGFLWVSVGVTVGGADYVVTLTVFVIQAGSYQIGGDQAKIDGTASVVGGVNQTWASGPQKAGTLVLNHDLNSGSVDAALPDAGGSGSNLMLSGTWACG
jgi:hypothetical protein